jgi:hypothetical protein
MLEPRSLYLTGSGTAEIFVDHLDLLKAKLTRVIRKTVLPALALLVVDDLPRRGLADINDRAPFQMV